MFKVVLLLLATLALQSKVIDSTVAMIGSKPITSFEVQKKMRETSLNEGEALELIIRDNLEEQEISKRSIDISPSEVYDEIKHIASNNGISVDELYDRVRQTTGKTSIEFKEQIKKQLTSQKLYSEIAYASMSEPSDDEIEEYIQLHKDLFSKPFYFDVIIYSSKDESDLAMVQKNPMFSSANLTRDEKKLYYENLPQNLAALLEATPKNSFTQIVSLEDRLSVFYMKDIQKQDDLDANGQKSRVINMIMSDKREQVLSDYFSRLKNSSQVKIMDKK